MKIDGIRVHSSEMCPPLAGIYKYFAVVQFLYVSDESGRRKVDKIFQETYGETKEEAEEKMLQQVRDWVKSQ
jgi:formyltetrahydrofolate synthetase